MSENNEIQIGFVGDFCLSGFYNQPYKEIVDTLKTVSIINSEVDLSVANFEFSITPEDEGKGKMSLPATMCNDIEMAGFNVFCLANNHIKDFGSKILLYTKEFLENKKIKTVGVGNNIHEAVTPLKVEVKGNTISIVNVTDATHYQAENQEPGVAPLIKKELINTVAKAVKDADITIVIIHADLEFTNLPAPWKIKLSRKLVDHGANIVIHHHSHTLQGIESYEGGLIAYSLGNFIFPVHTSPYMKDREGNIDEGAYLKVKVSYSEVGKVKLSYDIIPTHIDLGGKLNISTEVRKDKILKDIANYSDKLSSYKLIERAHFSRCKTEMKSLMMGSYYALRKNGIKGSLNYIKHHLSTAQHTGWIRGFFTWGRR